MLLTAHGFSKGSAEWVVHLPAIIRGLNNEVTRLTGKKPSKAISLKSVHSSPSSVVPGCSVGLKEPLIPSDALVRYPYQCGELEGGR